jgi:hypothetical protein
MSMLTLNPASKVSAAGPTTQISALWNAAIEQYEKTSGIKLDVLSGVHSIDDVLVAVQDQNVRLELRRHSGSGIDKLRTQVKKCLSTIQELGGIIAPATSSVRMGAQMHGMALIDLSSRCFPPAQLFLLLSVTSSMYGAPDLAESFILLISYRSRTPSQTAMIRLQISSKT